jgi:hypothetical protein
MRSRMDLTRGPAGRRRVAIVGMALALLAFGLAPATASAVPIGDSSAEKQQKLLDILERFVPRAEAFWCLNASPGAFCDTSHRSNDSSGWFDIGPNEGVGQERGEASIAYVYATLLAAYPACTSPGVPAGCKSSFAGFDRVTVIENHLHQAIRHLAFTHHTKLSGGWGGKPLHRSGFYWQGSPVLSNMGHAAQQAWGLLSSTTRTAVSDVVRSQADEVTPDVGSWNPEEALTGDTKAEENGWNAAGAATGAALLPGDARARAWDLAAKDLAINSSTRTGDGASSTTIDGTQLRVWANTFRNLEDDYTVTNHGFFHPVYSWGTHVGLADAMVLYKGAGLVSDPQAFMFRVQDVWDQTMGRLATDDGDFVLPSGSDWTTHDYGQLPYLGMIATRLRRDDAAVYESRAIDNFKKYQDATLTIPRTGVDDGVGIQSDVYRNAALDWWLHELYGPAPDPDQAAYDADRNAFNGAWVFGNQRTVVGRLDGNHATMSWNFSSGNAWPTGLVVPGNADYLADPAFVNPWMTSAVDGANASVSSYSCDCRSGQDHFSTAAIIGGSRMFSMSAFNDGTTLLLDRGSGATASFGFEDIPGFTGSRTVRSDSGTGVEGNLTGDWANIGDRFGLVVKGGSGLWADQGDVSRDQPPLWLRGSLGDGSRNRGAAIFPNATGTTTDQLEGDVIQPTVSDASWAALTAIAQNGTGKVAVARWGGGGTATVSAIRSSLGVPIPERSLAPEMTVTGSSGSTTFSLASPESKGYEARFFVSSTSGKTVTARWVEATAGPPQFVLLHNGGTSNAVTVKYDPGAGGRAQTVTRTLAADQAAIAVAWDGTLQLVLISASTTEPPGRYHAKLAFDGDQTSTDDFWVSDGVTLSTNPQCLTLDFGAAVNIGSVVMIPRRGYGPKDYRIETGRSTASPTCSATTDWAERARVTSSGDGTTRLSSWTPVSANFVRIKISAAYGSGPPFFVQIRELAAASR